MKVVIAGGGTGGHLYPGIAIAREVLSESGSEVLFIGTRHGLEARVLPEEGLPVRFITAGRLKGMNIMSILKTLATLPVSVRQAARLMREARPDVVVGVGGYSSGPAGLAAWIMRIPLVIVEINSYAGLANRLLSHLADRVALCFPGTARKDFFPQDRTVLLGPLVRRGIDSGDKETALRGFGLDAGRFTVFVMGGSLGAHAINAAMTDAGATLKDISGIQILHQTGDRDIAEVVSAYRKAGIKAAVYPFIKDMAGAYATADLVVSRAGGTTVAELMTCGKRAVLIPYPFAADNHQEHNARALAASAAAEVLLQKDLTAERLSGLIRKYAGAKSREAITPVRSSAAGDIARICRDHVQKN